MTSQSKMTNRSRNREHGVALLFSLLALLLLTAITASLIMLSGTETLVNYNYRTEEIAFFAAKSGIYEALDRMQQSNATTIAAQIPTSVPSATGGVLYIINAGSSLTVKPWDITNAYYDDELCHEGYTIAGMTSASPDVPCTTLPSGSTWYTTVNSNYPWSGTSTAIPYVWVRINWKQNSSQSYLGGGPSAPVTSTYSVNSTGSASTPVCWNGGSEVLLSTPSGVTPAYTSCEQYQTCSATSPSVSTPVLMITALAVTSNGSRQMVQAEAALNPPTVTVPACGTSDAYGFFAYGNGFSCSNPALIIGGNAIVDGYNSANGPYSSTNSPLLGDVGTNQGATALGSSTNIGGTVYVPNVGSATPPGPGSCPADDFSVTGSPGYGALAVSAPITTPTIFVPSDSSTTNVTSGTITPGNYQDISIGSHGSLTLTAPGTYVVDCITMGSWGSITTSPATKAITIYVTGTGCSSAPFTMNSHSTINNASGVSENIQIVYNGTGTISLEGGPQMCAVVNAPNAAVVLHGGGDFYGTIMANSIDDTGGTSLHFDAADKTLSGVAASTATATATGSYNMLGYHSLPY